MTEQEIEIEDLRAALTEAHGKLFEAGKFAGRQDALITSLVAALEHFVEQYLDLDEAYGLARAAIAKEKAFRAE